MHGKTVNSAVSLIHSQREAKNILFATGSEDGDICLFTWSENSSVFDIKQKLNRHASSVRALDLVPVPNTPNSFFLISGGGRSELIVWKISKFSYICVLRSCFISM